MLEYDLTDGDASKSEAIRNLDDETIISFIIMKRAGKLNDAKQILQDLQHRESPK